MAGRPPIERSDTQIAEIEHYAGRGFTLHQIATLIDISDSTLDRWLKEPTVKRAYERGRLIATEQVGGTLFNLAIEGDVVAAIFWLKSQAGWTDRPKDETPAGSQVVFYIPDNGRGVVDA